MNCESNTKYGQLTVIKMIVGAVYDVTIEQLNGKGQAQKFALPRHVAMYCAIHKTAHSKSAIGRSFGGRDHTTVSHAERRIEDRIIYDDEFGKKIALIIKELEVRLADCDAPFIDDIDAALLLLRKRLVEVVSNTPNEILLEILDADNPAHERLARLLGLTSEVIVTGDVELQLSVGEPNMRECGTCGEHFHVTQDYRHCPSCRHKARRAGASGLGA